MGNTLYPVDHHTDIHFLSRSVKCQQELLSENQMVSASISIVHTTSKHVKLIENWPNHGETQRITAEEYSAK